ncbi:MAG: NUDIX hydrolase [Candidatus Saccharibacteria bacterium]
MRKIAKALIIDGEGKVLVLYRSDSHPHFARHLDFPGGIVELNELAADAVAREIYEEAGITIKQTDLKLIHEETMPSGKICMLYSCTIKSERPIVKISWEHGHSEWLTTGQIINTPMPEKVDDYFEMVVRYLRSAIA